MSGLAVDVDYVLSGPRRSAVSTALFSERVVIMTKFKRKKLWVDPKVQGALIIRVLAYWVSCLVTVGLLARVTAGMASVFPALADKPWLPFVPAVLASLFFLPLVVQDTLHLSNRFVGPMFRLRRSMRALANGEKVNKVYFRDGDMWQDFADSFNDLVTRIEMLEDNGTRANEPSEGPASTISGVVQESGDIPVDLPEETAAPNESTASA